MHVSPPEHDAVLHVARNMRAIDAEEIYGLRNHENPHLIAADVMAAASFSWVCWCNGWPVAIVGGREMWPGRWSMHCFGTTEFGKIGLPLTRFVKHRILPALFEKLGAKRLEADSHWRHVEAHEWLKSFGAVHESTKKSYGRHGDDYFGFAFV